MVLLQIDERRAAVTAFGQQIERIDLLATEKDSANFPLHALFNDALTAAETIEDFEGAFRVADRARADADGVVLVQHDDRNVTLREIDRCGKPDGPGADNDHRPSRRRAVLIG